MVELHRRPPLAKPNIHDKSRTKNDIGSALLGEKAALERLISEYTPLAYRKSYGMLRNEQDAWDVAHDTMIKVMTNLEKYDSSWAFSTWVSRIAKNTSIDLLRKRRRISWAEVPDLADGALLADENMLQTQQAEMVRELLSDLPPMYREVLQMHHYQDLKYREIADSLDLPIGTVMNRIHRARKKLRRNLEKMAA